MLTVLEVAIDTSVLFSLLALKSGYQKELNKEVNHLGAHILAVPKGCPYEAASLVMYGGMIPKYLSNKDFRLGRYNYLLCAMLCASEGNCLGLKTLGETPMHICNNTARGCWHKIRIPPASFNLHVTFYPSIKGLPDRDCILSEMSPQSF